MADGSRKQAITKSTVKRRNFLKAGIVGGAFTGFAGCLHGGGSGSGEDILVGGTPPLSGIFAALGESMERAMKLAVQHANEEGDVEGREVKLDVLDTQSDPGTGRSRAREHIQNGAAFLVGSINSGTASSIGELAVQEDVIYMAVGGSNSLTGEDCRENMFVVSDSATMQANASMGYVLEQGLGETIYQISADHEWGMSIHDWQREFFTEEYGVEIIGETIVPLGETEYSSAITEAQNADPDIIAFNTGGGMGVASSQQAFEFGALDEHVCVWPGFTSVDAAAIGSDVLSHDNMYFATPWYWEHDTPDAVTFVEEYRDEFDTVPGGYDAGIYGAIRTTLQAINDTGETDGSSLRPELEGKQLTPQLWGVGEKLRACDHRLTLSSMTVQGRDPSEVEGDNLLEILNVSDNPEENMRTCEETGCEL